MTQWVDLMKHFNYVWHNKINLLRKPNIFFLNMTVKCCSEQSYFVVNWTFFLEQLTFCPVYASQEATVRTGHGTIDWFQIGKGVRQGCISSSCLFNLYAKYIMRNAGLEEAQAEIKIARRNINNLRYADDTTLYGRMWRGTKKPLDERERGEWKSWLKTQHQKTKVMASGPITSWQIDGETVETVTDFIFGSPQKHCRCWLQPWN